MKFFARCYALSVKLSGLLLVINLPLFAADLNVVPVSDPQNAGQWILNESLSDEFNGTILDKTKWWILGENGDYRSKWKGRAPGQFAPQNVRVENGDLILTSRWEPDFVFANEKQDGTYYGGTATSPDMSKPITQACVMSENFFRYGYMEIRCKAADAPVTSSFWTTGYHSEIDMTENYGKLPIGNPEGKPTTLEKKYRTNMINWDPDKPADHKNWKVEDLLDVRVADDYYVYGFEWDKDYIKTYFNGKLIRSVTRLELEANNQWRHDYPQELWIDAEVFSWYGLPSQADLAIPAEYKIDYVRIWQKQIAGPYFNAIGFEGPFQFQGRSQAWYSSAASNWRIKNEKVAEGDFSARFKATAPFSGTYVFYSPYAAINLPAGSNEISCKVWIDPNTTIDKMDITLSNPKVVNTFTLTGVEKGKWVTLTKTFTRSAASSQSLTAGDRLQVTLTGTDIKSTEALMYVDDITFKNVITTGVNDVSDGNFSVYPTPAHNMLTILSNEPGTVSLFNGTGTLVQTKKKRGSTEKIDISNLQSGLYIVQLASVNGVSSKKIVKK